jgi:hypothetical protein
MEPQHKKILKAIVLELRHLLEGLYDGDGRWHPGDLEQRLAAIGIRRDRNPVPIDELPHLSDEDKNARKVVEAYLTLRQEAGISPTEAVAEFVRETAYTWSNRLLALRCMEARELIDEVILQKDVYGGRSLEHHRLAQRKPECCTGEDDGLFAILEKAFAERANSLPLLFDPKAPGVALRPSTAALKRCIGLLSGKQVVKGQEPATSEVFKAPDVLGWAYQYYQEEEKKRVDDWLKSKKGFKCEGTDIIPKTSLYTEPYMVKFLVQNSLGATWVGMHPDSKLFEKWEYYVRDADRAVVEKKSIQEVTFLDPACGSGHFLLEAFELFFDMYMEEGKITEADEICQSILKNNLYGIDIDERAVQIAEAALWMKAAEKGLNFLGTQTNLVATNIHLPKGKDHLKEFLKKHPEDVALLPGLEVIFEGLGHVDELGSLLQVEEPVEKELRHLKEIFEAEKDKPKQSLIWTEMAKPVQGALPLGVGDYEDWKSRILSRLKEHFTLEAGLPDLVQSFFSQFAGKGLEFFDLLTRRYDIVATNPPYLGSGNVGAVVKKYLDKYYSPGKRDLYAAFILRCLELAVEGGRVAMVTQQSWMFLRSFVDLRAVKEDELKNLDENAFKGLLRDTTLEALAHLGPGAFGEIGGEVVNIALFTLAKVTPSAEHRLTAFRLVGLKSLGEKSRGLLESLTNSTSSIRFAANQSRIVNIFESPLVYWVEEDTLRTLENNPKLLSIANVVEGLGTRCDQRFIRTNGEGVIQSRSAPSCHIRWVPFVKGGRYCKWCGLQFYFVDWQHDGIRILNFKDTSGKLRSRPQNISYYFKGGLTYTCMAQGSMGVRSLMPDTVAGDAGPIIFPSGTETTILGIMNSRFISYLLRIISPTLQLKVGYVKLTPLPLEIDNETVKTLVEFCVSSKLVLLTTDITERTFAPYKPITKSMRETVHGILKQLFSVSVFLHSAEMVLDSLIIRAYAVSNLVLRNVLNETGTPAGGFPLIHGYDTLPPATSGLPNVPDEILNYLKGHERGKLDPEQFQDFKCQVQSNYEIGPGLKEVAEETEESPVDNENEEEVAIDSGIPIPSETFLEELAQKLKINPISVYWILKEGIEKEGWHCPPEEQRITADRFTVTVLHLLGHRWPKQIEVGEPIPEWADEDGVIPLTESTLEATLLARVRERIAADFEGGDVTGIEREFAEIVERPLGEWLETEFFKHHTRQFKRRPIAWQIQSSNYTRKKRPAYACIVYYHRTDGDLLPKIRTQHVIPLRQRYETELRMIEGISVEARSERQDRRRVELEALIQEFKEFESTLQKVSIEGFAGSWLKQYAFDDAMLCLKATWLKRLSEFIKRGPLEEWQKQAEDTHLKCPLADWIEDAFQHLDYFCSAVGPKPPDANTFSTDLDPVFFSSLISPEAKSMVKRSVELACDKWWRRFDEGMLSPLRDQIKGVKEEIKNIKEEMKETEVKNMDRISKLKARVIDLEGEVRRIQKDLGDRADRGKEVRKTIEGWVCPEAETWGEWLAMQPMYDAISSLDGNRTPPVTIEDFIRQEASYAPDINDGVRVNIAPLQKAGLLAADVLAKKDLDKAIEDRGEWRADERRWCREGKLPQPGWWPMGTI